jgi:hypothetical protein
VLKVNVYFENFPRLHHPVCGMEIIRVRYIEQLRASRMRIERVRFKASTMNRLFNAPRLYREGFRPPENIMGRFIMKGLSHTVLFALPVGIRRGWRRGA